MRGIERKLLVLERAVRKEMLREVREMPSLSRIKLHRRARRNKRLMHRALQERRRYEYAARRALSREYGRVISIKMRQV